MTKVARTGHIFRPHALARKDQVEHGLFVGRSLVMTTVRRHSFSPLQSYVVLRYNVHPHVGCAQSVTFRWHAATADCITWSESVVQVN
jgi:hypothetical protein